MIHGIIMNKIAVGIPVWINHEEQLPELELCLDSVSEFFPVIVISGKWSDMNHQQNRNIPEADELIDSYSNIIHIESLNHLEPFNRNLYMIQAGKMGCNTMLILDSDESAEFPLGVEFFDEQLSRLKEKHPNHLGFSVIHQSARHGGICFTPRVILNPAFTRYRDRHNQMYFMDREVLSWDSSKLVGGIILNETKDFRSDKRKLIMRERNLRNPLH